MSYELAVTIAFVNLDIFCPNTNYTDSNINSLMEEYRQ
jgi:hypothetical protein